MTTYLTDSEGKFIPATQRPDGTWRKLRRVKEGYVPQEEVPLYESKGKQFAQRKTILPVGMCPLVAAANKKEREKQERAKAKKPSVTGEAAVATSKAHQLQGAVLPKTTAISGVNNKTKNTKPAKATNKTSARKKNTNNNNNTNLPQKTVATLTTLTNNLAEMQIKEDDDDHHQQADLSKELKKLKKKLREIESIEARIKSGELKKPEKDQLVKVKRRKQIVKEIEQLEAAHQ